MILVLWQEDQTDLAVELAIDVLRYQRVEAIKTRRRGRVTGIGVAS